MMRLVAVAGNCCLTYTEVVNSALDNLLVTGGDIFIDLGIKRGHVQKVAAKLLFGRGRPAKQPKRRL